MNTKKHSERNDLIHVYLLNVQEYGIYEQFQAAARCILKRKRLGKPVTAEHLAESEMVKSLSSKLNLFSMKADGVRIVESGDRMMVAEQIIEEAKEMEGWA